MAWSTTDPSGVLAIGAGLPALWTQQVAQDLATAGGAWVAYTPTVAGFTSVVTSTTGAYLAMGHTIVCRVSVTLGTVTTLGSSAISVTLPVTARSVSPALRIMCGVYKNSTAYVPTAIVVGTSAFTVMVQVPGGATPNLGNWTGAAPAAQLAGDIWTWSFTYEAA